MSGANVDIQESRPCRCCGKNVDHVRYAATWLVTEPHWAPCGLRCILPANRPEDRAEADAGLRHGKGGWCPRCHAHLNPVPWVAS
jgi:hypothetical protein